LDQVDAASQKKRMLEHTTEQQTRIFDAEKHELRTDLVCFMRVWEKRKHQATTLCLGALNKARTQLFYPSKKGH